MNTLKILGTILLVCIIGLSSLKAQSDYSTGIGFRAGPMPGLSVKHFISDEEAIEGIISSRWHGTIFQGLYEVHQDVFSNSNFNFYYGAGAHFGYWDLDGTRHPWYDVDGVYSAFGIDGIIGLEYSFDEIPFSLSLDWKPMFNIIDHTRFWMDDIGLTLRFSIR
jgi:hypothetical protein